MKFEKGLAVIGCGNLARSLLKAWLKNKIFKKSEMITLNRSQSSLKKNKKFCIHAFKSPELFRKKMSAKKILIIGVKPQEFFSTLDQFMDDFVDGQIIVSIAAGIPPSKIEKYISKKSSRKVSVLTAMPNLAASVGASMTTLYAAKKYSKSMISEVEALFSVCGKVEKSQEKNFHQFTVLGGSVPAFVFEYLKTYEDEFKKHGFTQKKAKSSVLQVFQGALDYYAVSSQSLDRLQSEVASKGGCTQKGIDVLQSKPARQLFKKHLKSAYDRAKNLDS